MWVSMMGMGGACAALASGGRAVAAAAAVAATPVKKALRESRCFTECSRAKRVRCTIRLDTRQKIELAGAVTEPLQVHTELVHQAQRQIRQRGALRVFEVTIALHLLVAPADDNHRDIEVVVGVAVAHAAAIEHDRMIE